MNRNPENSFDHIINLANRRPIDAVVTLSGGVKKIDSDKKVIAGVEIKDSEGYFRISSTAFGDPDPRQSLGWGKAKDIAAAELIIELNKIQTDKTILVASSRSTNNLSSVTDAEASSEYIRKLGVPNLAIWQEFSLDTFTELLEAARLAAISNWSEMVLVTTKYQRPRAEAMMNSILNVQDPEEYKKVVQLLAFNANRFNREVLPNRVDDHHHFRETLDFLRLAPNRVQPHFLEAEDALIHRNPRWYGALVAAAQSNPAYAAKLEMDTNAAGQWSRGEYGKTPNIDEVIEQWKSGLLP